MVERKQQPAAGAGLGAEQRFDVVLSARPDITPDEVRRRVENSFVMPMDKAEAMLKALETRDFIRVGQDVLRVRAEKAQRDLEGVGFKVELRSTLSLAPIDPRITCPHCGVRVAIGEDRLCPQCGENVSRSAPAKTLQTRIEAEERERIERQINRETQTTERSNQRELEEALRRRIRQDLGEGVRPGSILAAQGDGHAALGGGRGAHAAVFWLRRGGEFSAENRRRAGLDDGAKRPLHRLQVRGERSAVERGAGSVGLA